MTAPTNADVLAILYRIACGDGDTEVLAMRARAAVAAIIEERDALREISERQLNNIAFLLERCQLDDLPRAWRKKFELEHEHDRADLARCKGGA